MAYTWFTALLKSVGDLTGANTGDVLQFDGNDVISTTITSNSPIGGDGSDGDVTIPTGTTTLTRDMYYNNLTVDSSGTLNTGGYRIFVKNTLTNNGNITRGNTGTSALSAGTLGGSGAGGAGGLNNGSAGGNVNPSLGGTGGTANGGSSSPGAAGTVTAPTQSIRALPFAVMLTDFPVLNVIEGGSGGGGGGGDGVAVTGGTGGGGGGVMLIVANSIINSGTGTIDVSGGPGTDATGCVPVAAGSGGGGGGGGGGLMVLIYNSLSNSGNITAAGGIGGWGTDASCNQTNNGANGTGGTIIQITTA